MNLTNEYLKGTADELRAVASELDLMAKRGIDPQRLDQIARLSLQGAVHGLKDEAYNAKKKDHP